MKIISNKEENKITFDGSGDIILSDNNKNNAGLSFINESFGGVKHCYCNFTIVGYNDSPIISLTKHLYPYSKVRIWILKMMF